jgi:hypothetical protein
MVEHPDIVEEYFYLVERYLQCAPLQTVPLLASIFQVSWISIFNTEIKDYSVPLPYTIDILFIYIVNLSIYVESIPIYIGGFCGFNYMYNMYIDIQMVYACIDIHSYGLQGFGALYHMIHFLYLPYLYIYICKTILSIKTCPLMNGIFMHT